MCQNGVQLLVAEIKISIDFTQGKTHADTIFLENNSPL
jgi:hypothetical protein